MGAFLLLRAGRGRAGAVTVGVARGLARFADVRRSAQRGASFEDDEDAVELVHGKASGLRAVVAAAAAAAAVEWVAS